MRLRTIVLLPGILIGLGSSVPYREPIPAKVRASADRGIQYLLRAQNRDGSWGDEIGFPGDISDTTIALIALIHNGSTIRKGKHHSQVRKGVQWALQRIKNGLNYGDAAWQPHHTLIQRKLGPNIDAYYAAMLLGVILSLELDPWQAALARLKLRELTGVIARFQQPNGAFETSYEPMLTTVTAWMTLRQAHAAGVTVRGASVDKVMAYLEKECYEASTGIFREQKWGNKERFVTQAGGLRVFYGMGREREERFAKAKRVVLRMRFDQDVGGRAGGEEFLAALYAVQALHIGEPEDFQKFYPKITAALIRCQNRDGSWTGHHCITGRVFCTACSVIAMVTPNRLLPMAER